MPLRRSPQLTPGSLAARRANALKSTGPRTACGMARFSLNSLKHGRAMVLPDIPPASANGSLRPATLARKRSTAISGPVLLRLLVPDTLTGGARWTGLPFGRGAWPREGTSSEQSWNVLSIQCKKARGSSPKTLAKAVPDPVVAGRASPDPSATGRKTTTGGSGWRSGSSGSGI